MPPANDEPLELIELEDNLANAEKPPELPNGIYDAEIQSVSSGTSASGNQNFQIQCKIDTDAIPANMTEFFPDGSTLTYSRLLKPRSGDRRDMYNLKKFVEALGLDTNSNAIDPNDWMGQRCRVRIKGSMYQGEMRAGIQEIMGVTDSEPAKKTGTAKRAAPVDEEEEEVAPKKAAAGRRR